MCGVCVVSIFKKRSWVVAVCGKHCRVESLAEAAHVLNEHAGALS